MQDLSGICDRNPNACAVSRDALSLMARKVETGASIVAAGIAVSKGEDAKVDHGTLTAADMEATWSTAEAQAR